MFSFYLLTSFIIMNSPFSDLYTIVKMWSRALRWLKGHVTTKQDSLKKALLTTLPISFLLHLTDYRHLSICLTNVII